MKFAWNLGEESLRGAIATKQSPETLGIATPPSAARNDIHVMKKFFLVSCILLLASFFSACESNYAPTPPVATPSESLPLYGSQPSSGSTGDETSESGTTSKIVANPSTIYIAGSGKVEKSVVTVYAGAFQPDSTVTVYGKIENADDIESPPSILSEDKDSSKKDIQLAVNSSGGLSFTVQAGTSSGVYQVLVSGAPYYSKSMQSTGKGAPAGGNVVPGTVIAMSGADGVLLQDLVNSILSVTITILE